ncbi:MAG: TetR/AcrR family transcriptional regulator [Hahellaceae bacterium]|nr:TetR/AcrR family transcriptional regulator [Hahellaceae bacterium]MCP5170457.1 TetR/AcrR family transcriptional regulator [Hahellaceae bacterium]
MGRPTAFDRNEKLMLAMKLFWKQGYERTSMQDLIDTLGINRFSLYNTFGDKQTLFHQAAALYQEKVFAELLRPLLDAPPGTTGKDRILNYLDNACQKLCAPSGALGCLMQNMALERGQDDAMLRTLLQQQHATLENALKAALEDAKNEDCLATPPDTGQAACHIMTCVQGLIFFRKAGTAPDKIRAQFEYLKTEIQNG